MKVAFFVSSFSAFYQALQVLACRPEVKDVLWICSEPKLFPTLNQIKVPGVVSRIIDRPEINQMRSAHRWPKLMLHRWKERSAFRNEIRDLKAREVFFFDHFLWEIGLLWISWCSRICTVYFYNSTPSLTSEGRERLAARETKYRIGFGVKGVHFFFFQSNVSCVITPEFLSDYGIQEWKPTLSENEMLSRLSAFTPAAAKNYSVILLVDPNPEAPFINRAEFDRVWPELVRVFEGREERVLVKPHPRERNCPELLLEHSNEILTPWPVELLLHEGSRFLVATASTSMLARLSFKNLKRISVMDFVYRDSDRKKLQLKLLQESQNEICVPSTLEATVSLISETPA